jgi:serine/threonine protein phosphatase 1
MLNRILGDARKLEISYPTVVMLGDYVDRGSDSKGVLDILTSSNLREQIKLTTLCGKHEDAMLSVLNTGLVSRANTWCLGFGGFETMESYGVDTRNQSFRAAIDQFSSLVPKVHRDFLENLALSHEANDIFFCHAGIDPTLSLADQNEAVLLHGTKSMFKTPAWNSAIEKLVVHGHWTSEEVVVTEKRIGLDTRCGYAGGHLSAVRLNGRIVEAIFPPAVNWEDI